MGLPRLILFAIIIGGGIWLWRRINSRSSTPAQSTQTQPMIRCAQCDVHVPHERALQKDQHWYCSSQHLAQGPKARD